MGEETMIQVQQRFLKRPPEGAAGETRPKRTKEENLEGTKGPGGQGLRKERGGFEFKERRAHLGKQGGHTASKGNNPRRTSVSRGARLSAMSEEGGKKQRVDSENIRESDSIETEGGGGDRDQSDQEG